METTKELATKKNNALSTDVASMFEEMEYNQTEAKDLLIPKILLMQGSSERVKTEATHKAGDIIKSTTGEVYGSARDKDAKGLRFIPIFMYKTWVKHELLGKKKQYVETFPVTPENTDMKWEQTEEVDGVTRTYTLTKNINFYVVLEKDFGNPLAVPHVLTFRSTSARAANILMSWFAECNVAQKARQVKGPDGQLMLPFAKVFELGGKLEADEENSWFVFKTHEVDAIKDDKDERIAQCFNWYKAVKAYDHVKDVDNSDATEGSAPATAATKETRF